VAEDEVGDQEPDEERQEAPAERHGVPVVTTRGQEVLFPPPEEYVRVVGALRDEGFDLCCDLTAVDYLTHPGRTLPEGVTPERFEVVVNLLALEQRARVRVRVQVSQAERVVPSLFDLYPGTEAPEREVYDMFGLTFEGHPDLTRILMPEDWEGYPLRKDFAVGRIPVQFKAVGGGK
jgi:NADH-quinone oxidoreductase subunit C